MPLSVRPLLGIFQLRIWFRFSDLSHTSMWQINLSKEDFIIFSPTLEKISDKKGENIAVLIIHFFWVRRWNHQYILLCGYNSFFHMNIIFRSTERYPLDILPSLLWTVLSLLEKKENTPNKDWNLNLTTTVLIGMEPFGLITIKDREWLVSNKSITRRIFYKNKSAGVNLTTAHLQIDVLATVHRRQ